MAGTTGARRVVERVSPRIALVGLLAWWWPSLTGGGAPQADVLLAGDAEIIADSNPVLRHMRERGLGVEVESRWTSWCDVAATDVAATDVAATDLAATDLAATDLAADVAANPATIVVLSFRHEGACATSPGAAVEAGIERLRAVGQTVIVIRSMAPGTDPGVDAAIDRAAETGRATLADAGRLLGDSTVLAMPCQWWDQCGPDGLVAVREPDGSLTWDGLERVGRVTAGVVP